MLLRCACSIQQSAALALGRLANYSDDLAEAVVQNEILPQLVSWTAAGCLAQGAGSHGRRRVCVWGGGQRVQDSHRRRATTSLLRAAMQQRHNCPSKCRCPFCRHSMSKARLLLPPLWAQVYSLAEQNRFYKKAAGYCLRAVAK
jgi:hypothetical protein